jgi:hypothetical protein
MDHYKNVVIACGSKVLYDFCCRFFACGRKTGNDRIGASTLPKAKHHLEAITAMATP